MSTSSALVVSRLLGNHLACSQVHAVRPNPVKTFFAPARPARLPQLSWDPLEQPPGFARRHLQLDAQQGKPTDNAGRICTMHHSAEAKAEARNESPAEQPRKKQKVHSAIVACPYNVLCSALLGTLTINMHLSAMYKKAA